MERLTIRLSSDDLASLQSLVDRGDFMSLSEAVNHAISMLIAERGAKPEDCLPDDRLDLSCLVRSQSTSSFDDSVRESVRDHVRRMLDSEG